MKILIYLLDFLVITNLYVSFGICSLTGFSMQIYGLKDYRLLLFVFFSTLFYYNFIRLINLNIDFKNYLMNRKILIYNYRFYFWNFVIITGIFSIYFVLPFFKILFWPLIITSIISMAYGIPFIKIRSKSFKLRELPGVKIFFISIVWTIVSEVFPALLVNQKVEFLAVLERFLFVFAITIPFDIRDLKIDENSMATIPQFFGVQKAKCIAISCLLLAEVFMIYRGLVNAEFNIFGCFSIYIVYEISIILIYFSHKAMSETYVNIGVEGMSILLGGMFLFSQII